MSYSLYLEKALDRIFTNYNDLGFWDGKEGKIIESLYHDDNWNWMYSHNNNYRYGLFALSMILIGQDIFNLNINTYQKKIIRNLEWIDRNQINFSESDFTYGGLLCLTLGYKNYNLFKNEEKKLITNLKRILSAVIKQSDNQHYLILIAAKYCIDIFNDQESCDLLKILTDKILDSQSDNGFFLTGDIRAYHHQRTMYTLWGLIFSSWYYKYNEIKETVEKTLMWVWNNRRDGIDDGFTWHPSFYWVPNRYGIKVPIYLPISAKHLFECHQTFFSNAINLYNYRYKEEKFLKEKNNAIAWIFGNNRINKNLVENTLIDIPSRIMDIDGSLHIKNQQFKGSYEIGSFILSMAKER